MTETTRILQGSPFLAFLLLAGPGYLALAQADEVPSGRPIEWLKELVGDWHGTATIEGDPTLSFPAKGSYTLTGSGSTVVESLDLGGHTMTSVYHEDDGRLRMTHFCSAGNQPRLIEAGLDVQNRSVRLEFVDITNLASPEAFHVVGWEVMPDQDSLSIHIVARVNGAERHERVELQRTE